MGDRASFKDVEHSARAHCLLRRQQRLDARSNRGDLDVDSLRLDVAASTTTSQLTAIIRLQATRTFGSNLGYAATLASRRRHRAFASAGYGLCAVPTEATRRMDGEDYCDDDGDR